MKTTVLTSVFLLALGLTVKAQQTTVLSQDFEDTAELQAQQWGGIDLDGDEVTFGLITTQPVLVQLGFSGNVMGSSNFALDDENNPVPVEGSDNLLISTVVELPTTTPLSLSMRIAGAGTAQTAVAHYAVYVVNVTDLGTAGGSTEAFATFINTQTPVSQDDTNGLSEIITADISSHAGQSVYVIVRHYNSTGSTYVFVDDMEIKSGTLGTQDFLASQFTLYPNPATSVINLESANGMQFNNAAITDVNGRTLKTLSLNGTTNATVNVDDLATGTYLLTVDTDKGTVTKKIIKK